LYLVGGLFLVVSPGDLATNSLLSLSRYLVGGLEHDFFSHHIGNVIIPTDEVHHFSEGVGIPPTSYGIQ